MLVFDLTDDTPIELEVKCSGQTLTFTSKVSVIKNDFILIDKITTDGRTIGFSNNCTINLLLNEDDVLYVWKDVKVTLVRYDGEIYHKIHDPATLKEVYNRRGAYRIYIGEEMPITISSAKGKLSMNVLVKDISESGIGFISDEELDIGKIVRLKLRECQPTINLSATIVRKEYNPDLRSTSYGCMFLQRNQDLGRYIARKQNQYMKRRNYNI